MVGKKKKKEKKKREKNIGERKEIPGIMCLWLHQLAWNQQASLLFSQNTSFSSHYQEIYARRSIFVDSNEALSDEEHDDYTTPSIPLLTNDDLN
jgi:hypothetical protein